MTPYLLKGSFILIINLRIMRWWDYSGLPWWALNVTTSVLTRKMLRETDRSAFFSITLPLHWSLMDISGHLDRIFTCKSFFPLNIYHNRCCARPWITTGNETQFLPSRSMQSRTRDPFFLPSFLSSFLPSLPPSFLFSLLFPSLPLFLLVFLFWGRVLLCSPVW
jgi:hypothetical protein